MTRALFTLAALALLTGCGTAGASPVSARAIGCLPGDCPPKPRPTASPCAKPRPLAIGCVPGQCGPKPGPRPCR